MRYNSKQQGTVLLVSLILLLILTSAGVSTISTALLEGRLASNNHDRHIAFQSAESALIAAESLLLQQPFANHHWSKNCQGNRCFSPSCQNGLCLNADYARDGRCLPGSAQPWTNVQLWQNARYHRTLQPFQDSPQTARYIVEFRCFIDDSDPPHQPPMAGYNPHENIQRAALYRITVLASGGTESARIMLQSILQQPEIPAPENTEPTQEQQPVTASVNAQQLFKLRAQQRRSWQQLDITF